MRTFAAKTKPSASTHITPAHTPLASAFGRAGNTLAEPKLVVGQPADKYEQEADRVAAKVRRSPGVGPVCSAKT